MDVIFIEDRKEFDSITRNENLKYVKEHRNTVLLTHSTDIPRNVNKDIKLTDSNVGYSVKYISESANVYSVGSVWVELKNIDYKLVKDNIKISLGTSADYYTNLRVALETKKPKEYVDLMRDSLKQVSKALNDEHGKDSEMYHDHGDYNFCVRLALFDGLFANFANRMDGFDVGDLLIGMKKEDEYIEKIDKLISDISDAKNNGDKEKYKDLDSKLESMKNEYKQYINSSEYKEERLNKLEAIYSQALEGIREHNTYHLARIANFEEYILGIKSKKYCSILETYEYFIKDIFWNNISLDSFLEISNEDHFFKYDSCSNGLLVFENGQDSLIYKNSIILVGSNGVGKSKFLNYIYKLLSDNIFQNNKDEGEIVCLHKVDVFINGQKKDMKILPIFIDDSISKDDFFEMLVRVLIKFPNKIRMLISVLENDFLFSDLDFVKRIDRFLNEFSEKFDLPGIPASNLAWSNILKEGENIYEKIYRETSLDDFYCNGYRNLSSGQKNIIHLIIFICFSVFVSPKYLKDNNEELEIYGRNAGNWSRYNQWPIIIFDEPENSLHPPFISACLKILSIFHEINRYGSTIFATHSPVVVQEFTSDMVRIMKRNLGEKSVFERPSFETYGENIGILTDRIFGRDPLNTGFRQTLKNIVSSLSENELSSPGVREKYIYPKIGVKSLGMEASMVLNGLISSRRKNIELQYKNS